MATTLTQAHLDELDEAISLGARTVAFADGKRVTYRTIDEMIQARRHLSNCLANSSPAVLRKVVAHTKGTTIGHGSPWEWRYS